MKKLFSIILLFTCFNSFSQELVFQQVFIKAHDVEAYDAFLKNHFSKIHQKRVDEGGLFAWDAWKVVDTPQEDFTHMVTYIYDFTKEPAEWNAMEALGMNETQMSSVMKNVSSIRERVGKATLNDLADVNVASPVNNQYIKWDSGTSRWIQGTGSAGILDIVEDVTPQLGGTLDANGNTIDMGTNVITDAGVANWNTAYAWGNHATAGYVTAYTNTTYSQQSIQDNADVKLRLTGSDGVLDDIKLTAGTNVTFTAVGANGFTINATAQQSGGATVTTSDSAPSAPDDGDLWWKSDEGRLKVYYNDQNSSQWVDASPPLANTVLTNGTNKIQVSTTASPTQDAVELWGGNAKRWRMVQGGTLLPNADDAYDIGSSSYKVRDLYLGPTSLHIGTLDISESSGKLVLPAVEMTGHIIPDSNATYDIGNAEYKIRHLFLSDNTLYHEGPFIKTAQHDAGGSAQSASYVITLAKLKDALNASSNFDQFKSAILAITDAT